MKSKPTFWSTFIILVFFIVDTILQYENLDLSNRFLLIFIFIIISIVKGIKYIQYKKEQ